MNRVQKQDQVNEIRDRFARMTSAVVTDFRGLDVESATRLRDEFRKVGAEYKVIKNKLFGLAVKDAPFHGKLVDYLVGPTAVAWSYDDPAAPARVAVAFAKTNDKLRIKCAVVGKDVVDDKGVISLSKMPGKNELLGTMLATFMAPAQSFVRLLAAGPTNFVYLLDARRRQLEEGK
jgi:large subunit ribosomal protein L10